MISKERATKIAFEKDSTKREKMVDALTEEDAKYILKVCLKVLNGQGVI